MSPTLWFGIVFIICILELVRIGLSTYVLVHILQLPALRRRAAPDPTALQSLRSSRARAKREALLDPTLVAIRRAMDEVAAQRAGPPIEQAIDALDAYARALVEERGSR